MIVLDDDTIDDIENGMKITYSPGWNPALFLN
jgi:hypothetical protein